MNETEYGQVGFTRTIMLKLVRWLNTSFWRCWKRAEFWNQQSNKHLTRWLASYSMWRWKGSHLSFCLPGGFQFSSFSSETANLRLWLDNLNPFWVLNLFLCNFFFSFDIWHWRQETTQVSEEADMWQSEVAVSLRDELQQQQQWTFEHLVHVVNSPRNCESTY